MSADSAVEFRAKIDSDTALQEEFFPTIKYAYRSQLVESAKRHGFDFKEDGLRQLADQAKQVDLSDADLDKVVGGAGYIQQNL